MKHDPLRAYCTLLILAVSGCECDESEPSLGDDVSILIGEGEVLSDADRQTDAPDTGGLLDLPVLETGGPDRMMPDMGDPCFEAPSMSLDAEEAFLRIGELDGVQALVTGTATIGDRACTDNPCDDGTNCCNRCRSALFLGGLELRASRLCIPTATVACQGGLCELDVCSPPAVGLPAGYVGFLRSEPRPILELIRVNIQ